MRTGTSLYLVFDEEGGKIFDEEGGKLGPIADPTFNEETLSYEWGNDNVREVQDGHIIWASPMNSAQALSQSLITAG